MPLMNVLRLGSVCGLMLSEGSLRKVLILIGIVPFWAWLPILSSIDCALSPCPDFDLHLPLEWRRDEQAGVL